MSGILVVFATKNGSTKTAAEAIATELEVNGTTVDVRPAKAAREPVTGRDLVVWAGRSIPGDGIVTRIASSNGIRKISLACRSPYSGWDRGRTGRSPGSERGCNWTVPG
jgi:hypothetical protein